MKTIITEQTGTSAKVKLHEVLDKFFKDQKCEDWKSDFKAMFTAFVSTDYFEIMDSIDRANHVSNIFDLMDLIDCLDKYNQSVQEREIAIS